MGTLDAFLHSQEHAAIHGKADRLDDGGPESEPGRDVVRASGAVAADQARAALAERLDQKQPAAAAPRSSFGLSLFVGRSEGDEVATCLETPDAQGWYLGVQR